MSPRKSILFFFPHYFNVYLCSLLFFRTLLCTQCWQHGAAEASVRRGQGCLEPDTAGSSRFRSSPTTGHSRARQRCWWHLWESVSETGKTAARQRGARGKRVRNSPGSTRASEGGGEEVLQAPEQGVPCSPWGDHGGAGGYFLKELRTAEEPR